MEILLYFQTSYNWKSLRGFSHAHVYLILLYIAVLHHFKIRTKETRIFKYFTQCFLKTSE